MEFRAIGVALGKVNVPCSCSTPNEPQILDIQIWRPHKGTNVSQDPRLVCLQVLISLYSHEKAFPIIDSFYTSIMLQNLRGSALIWAITLSSGSCYVLFGYDQGVLGGLVAQPSFLKAIGNPSASYLGTIVARECSCSPKDLVVVDVVILSLCLYRYRLTKVGSLQYWLLGGMHDCRSLGKCIRKTQDHPLWMFNNGRWRYHPDSHLWCRPADRRKNRQWDWERCLFRLITARKRGLTIP